MKFGNGKSELNQRLIHAKKENGRLGEREPAAEAEETHGVEAEGVRGVSFSEKKEWKIVNMEDGGWRYITEERERKR